MSAPTIALNVTTSHPEPAKDLIAGVCDWQRAAEGVRAPTRSFDCAQDDWDSQITNLSFFFGAFSSSVRFCS